MKMKFKDIMQKAFKILLTVNGKEADFYVNVFSNLIILLTVKLDRKLKKLFFLPICFMFLRTRFLTDLVPRRILREMFTLRMNNSKKI